MVASSPATSAPGAVSSPPLSDWQLGLAVALPVAAAVTLAAVIGGLAVTRYRKRKLYAMEESQVRKRVRSMYASIEECQVRNAFAHKFSVATLMTSNLSS